MMKISILTPDLSHNCFGRAYLLAGILKRRFEIEVVGPIFGEKIWKPLSKEEDLQIKSVEIQRIPRGYLDLIKLYKKIDGDIIYASKPLFPSYGLACIKKIKSRKPLVLDIDDWQWGFIIDKYREASSLIFARNLFFSVFQFHYMSSIWTNFICEKLSKLAEEITVSNIFLQKRFGGEIIHHGKDTNFFNPKNYNKYLIRQNYDIDEKQKLIMFFGTPRAHKGLEELIIAMNQINDDNVLLMIIGLNDDDYCKKIINLAKKSLKKRFIGIGLQPFNKVPEIIAMADIIVIPQRRNFRTYGQIPSKVFDAMAMAKPIIATNVSDLPIILRGCGWIVEPEKPMELSKTIRFVLNNPDKAKEYGRKARQKCIRKYSCDVLEKKLIRIFKRF